MINIFLSIFFSCFLLTLTNSSILACTCKYPIDLSEKELVEGSFKAADFVFTGKVIKVFQKQFKEGKDLYLEGEKTVILEIISDFKNNIRKKQISIKTGIGNGDCGFPFEKGKKYLVYAVFTKVLNSKSQYTKTEIHSKDCSRTSLFSQANTDIEIINQMIGTK